MRLITAMMLMLSLALPLRAQEAGGPRAVIAEQLELFQQGDFASAFDHASPVLRDQFGSAGNFGAMVRQGYPMVWQPQGWRFAGTEAQPHREIVDIEDAAGRLHRLEYQMIRTEAGWKIDGVRMLPSPEMSV